VTTFVDTSAWYALLDRADPNHAGASDQWRELVSSESLVTHSYVLVESTALVQRRLGIEAVDSLVNDLAAPATVTWVDAGLHQRAVASLLAARRRHVSLVDWVSFELMRQRSISRAFAFDDDFRQQGFTVVP
jgi:uncharacterized protein